MGGEFGQPSSIVPPAREVHRQRLVEALLRRHGNVVRLDLATAFLQRFYELAHLVEVLRLDGLGIDLQLEEASQKLLPHFLEHLGLSAEMN